MECIVFSTLAGFGRETHKKTHPNHPFFLAAQCYPTNFFSFSKEWPRTFPQFCFALGENETFPRWCVFAFIRLGVPGGWKSFGWPGGRLHRDVHGGWIIFGWYFWRFFACIFSGWDVHWLMYLIFSQIYRITGHIYQWDISRNLDIFFRKQPELQPGSLCERLVRFGDVLTKKMGGFLGPCEFKFVVFFSKKDPRKELQLFLLLGWETDVLKANYFWGVHQFHLAYLGCLFGEVLRFFDLETNSHLH